MFSGGRERVHWERMDGLSLISYFFFQLGTLGAGNHYAEIQKVDEIYDKYAAKRMGIDRKGQVM